MEHQMAKPLFQVQDEVTSNPTEEVSEIPTAPPVEAASVTAEPEAPAPEAPAPQEAPAETARERADREAHEATMARVREFERKVREANKSEEKPHVPQPVAPAIQAQTKLEMELGAKMNAHHESLKLLRPAPVPTAADTKAAGSSTPVFRPADGAGTKEQTPAKLRG
jgi:hypothetical protein